MGNSTDTMETQKAFAAHCALTFPLVADSPTFEAAKAFGVYNESYTSNDRVTFVIDRSGIIRHVIAEEMSMDRHAMESLEALKKL